MPESLSSSKRSGSEKRQRGVPVSVRFLDDELVVIDHNARTAGLSRASYLRACGTGSPGPRAKRAPTVNAEALAHAVAALNKAGSNLNQLVRILNAGGAVSMTKEYFATLSEIRAAASRILEIVGRKKSV